MSRATVEPYEAANEIRITRVYDAPVALVWDAWTKDEHVVHWWGPRGFSLTTHSKDLRPGGSWRYVWRNAQGREFPATGTYREVEPPTRLVSVTHFEGEEQTSTTTFAEESGRTTVTVTMLFASKASRDRGLPYAKVGTEMNHARLDAYLAARR